MLNQKMQWKNLLNDKRIRDKGKSYVMTPNSNKVEPHIDHRNEFERDYDRIVSSSSVRRLQDKAQVFPLQENDFTRTRLTHSIEVSAIARSLGGWLEKYLIKEGHLSENKSGEIPALLATSGLVHDLGNPPFGHYGEDVIKKWFENWFEKNIEEQTYINAGKKNYINKNLGRISDEEKSDFLIFDGNAQSLRIVSKLQFLNDQYGINLTYGTLSSIIKYPKSSKEAIAKKTKKFGYFDKDKDMALSIMELTTESKSRKNPLALFLEAADDIAYLGADIEDGVKKKAIDWGKSYESLRSELTKIDSTFIEVFKGLDKKRNEATSKKYPDENISSVQNFRIAIQTKLIMYVKENFIKNYEVIMKGELPQKADLITCSEKTKEIRDALEKVQAHCYVDKEVLTLELVGDRVINDLLEIFVDAVVKDVKYDEKNGKMKAREKNEKVINMISDNFLYISLIDYNEGVNNKDFNNLTLYERLLLVTDFISGMTDSYAVDLHQKLSGIKLP